MQEDFSKFQDQIFQKINIQDKKSSTIRFALFASEDEKNIQARKHLPPPPPYPIKIKWSLPYRYIITQFNAIIVSSLPASVSNAEEEIRCVFDDI